MVVTVDALADLAPLPTRAHAGQKWLTLEARMRVHAQGVEGARPRSRWSSCWTVPASFDGTTFRAHFTPERPGQFSVQVVADLASGPRPVIEAIVFADVPPAMEEEERAAPGEDVDCADGQRDDDRLACMLATARVAIGLPPLARDVRLDALAREHASRMAQKHELAHDAGDGSPFDRLRAANLEPAHAGENVAHASTVTLAHRALWRSPSHRVNILSRDFGSVGVAVVRDDHGDAWVAELFASGLR